MVTELNPKATALSLAGVSVIIYLVCVALFAVAPRATLLVFREMFHGIDIMQIARTDIALGNVLLGFVVIVVCSLLVGWLFAVLYNYVAGKMK